MATIYKKTPSRSFAFRLPGLDGTHCYRERFRQLDAWRMIQRFQKEARVVHVGAKGRDPGGREALGGRE